MTVRRWMKRLQFDEWTEDTWTAVSAKIQSNNQWQELNAQLRKSGLKEEAARKQVQRWKRSGLTPNEACRRNSSAKSPKGTCSACGDRQAPGELYRGKFLCGVCYADKTGISPGE